MDIPSARFKAVSLTFIFKSISGPEKKGNPIKPSENEGYNLRV